jgi:ABC-type sugar transport system ATPase subunit
MLAQFGENGTGKSTLMRNIGSYLPPFSGSFFLDVAPGPVD